jgi:UTP:GlnB (protein PII) uridylyltransferase
MATPYRNEMLSVSAVTVDKLKEGMLLKELPEIYDLKNSVEHNAWHDNDTVFDHTVAVLDELARLQKSAERRISSYLNQTIDRYRRKDVLFIAAIFHDIAKFDTITSNDGPTSCPKHAELGARKVKAILDRFDLSRREKEIIIQIIRHHGDIHSVLDKEEPKTSFDLIAAKHQDIIVELILLALADVIGSQLRDNDPAQFIMRTGFLEKAIDEITV